MIPAASLRGARIAGIGAARPTGIVTGAALVERFGKSAEWLRARTGITRVHRLARGEHLLDLAVAAADRALTDAETSIEEIDVLMVATCSAGSGPDRAPLAERVRQRLRGRAMAVDANAVCAGFCYALGTANSLVASGAARTALVVGADQMSKLIDPSDLGTSILFGDGAGAAVVRACGPDEHGIAPLAWRSYGEHAELLYVPPGESVMRMQGQQVFRWAVDEVPKVIAAALAKAGVRAGDVEVFLPHQANLRITEAIRRRVGLEHAETGDDIVDSGNTSAASIPLALARLREAGRARRGQLAVLAGFGAGLTVAAQVVRLP